MNSKDIYALAEQLKNDPRFKKLSEGDIKSAVSDPQVLKAVGELMKNGGGEAKRAVEALLAGENGDAIRSALAAIKKGR